MDVYLKCLYDHIMEHLLDNKRPDMPEYRRRSTTQDLAWYTLTQTLTPEQLHLLELYQTARAHVFALEDQWLFQEAVSLGKWMARA